MLLCLILSTVVYLKTVSPQNLDVADLIRDDDLPPPNLLPVPFGHIFKDGIDDPSSDYMRPIDLLELRMRFPRTEEEEKYMLNHRRKNIIRIIPPPNTFNPRIEDVIMDKKDQNKNYTNVVDETRPMMEFDKIHKENVEGVLPKPQMKTKFRSKFPQIDSSDKDVPGKERYFSHDVFDIPTFSEDRPSWTTCEEFEKDIQPNNVVHPKDIVNIDWEPFYIWSPRKYLHATVYRFSYPTKKLVEEYKETYGRFLPTSLDWEQPKLLLIERLEMLLIAGDRKGLFYGITKQHIPLSMKHRNVTLPTLAIRVKIVDPYLALMYCNEFYATIMGTSETAPNNNEDKIEEAKVLKFKGEGYPVSRNKHLEKLKIMGREKLKKQQEERKVIKALPGYPGIDDII